MPELTTDHTIPEEARYLALSLGELSALARASYIDSVNLGTMLPWAITARTGGFASLRF